MLQLSKLHTIFGVPTVACIEDFQKPYNLQKVFEAFLNIEQPFFMVRLRLRVGYIYHIIGGV